MLSSLTGVHAFVVHRRATATESVFKQTGFWHIGTGAGGETMPGTDGRIRDDFQSNATYDTGPPPASVPLNTPHVYEVKADNASWASFLNGVAQGVSVTNTLTTYNPPQIGGNTSAVPITNFYYGDMAELIFYNRILAASERALLVGYLNGRYGLGAK